MIGAAGGNMHAAAAHAFHNRFVRHVDFHHGIQIHARFHHGFRLRQCARETVKQETVGAIGLGNAFFHQADDDVVTHQAALVHDFFGFQTQFRAGFNGGAQHIAGGNLRDIEFARDELRLRAFACARCAQQ